jgi:hypothetical protein
MPNWKKVIVSGSDAALNSLNVTNGVTGSLFGTASYSISASQAITSSFVTASNVFGPFGSNSVISSSFALTASYASFADNGGVTQILAGPNITISPLSGKGQVTISSTGTGSGNFNTATGSYGSFYDTTTQINPVANTANSMSFNETAITNGVSISGSISPFNTYIKTENAGVYNIQFSAQIDKTDSGADAIDIWLRKNGIDLIDTATKLTLTNNNTKVVAAWNWFVQSATNDYYQIIWSSADTDMRLFAEASSSAHPGIPSVIATANRVDQFLSNTGSFNGDFNGSFTGSLFGTASYATQALSASFATQAANATTASYVLNAVSASYATQALSASFSSTASYVDPLYQAVKISGSLTVTGSTNLVGDTGITLFSANADVLTFTGSIFTSGSIVSVGSLNINRVTSSLFGTASWAINAVTASYVLNAVSASFATSSSFASTSSFANNFTVANTLTLNDTLTDYATVASSIAGLNNIFTQATGSYTSAFFKYTVSNGANARSGEVMAVWNGATSQLTDFSTLDIGTTSPVTASIALVGTDVQFNIQTNTSGWRIKSLATFM